MLDFLSRIFDAEGFPARWNCGAWTPAHGWLHILSDLGVFTAYVAIPCVLAYFVLRRKDLPFQTIFCLFGGFILACSTTHLMEAIIFWWPAYRLLGVLKLITALISWATVFALVPIAPKVLALRSPMELEDEIQERRRAEQSLQQAREDLEKRVQERTAELSRANDVLRQEISVRARAEIALKESEARFRQLADAIPQLAWTARADGHIFWYNQRWYDYTGTTSEQMEGWGWQDVHDPQVLPRVLEGWTASIATGEPFEMTFPLRGANGEFRTFLTKVLPLRSPEGRVLQWFGTNTDVTERAQMEEALRQAHEELEGRVRERTADLAAANESLAARADQQAAVARFGQHALAGTDRKFLNDQAAAAVAQALGVEFSRVMELAAERKRLLLKSGVGWKEGWVGKAAVEANESFLPGFALLADDPVVCDDWKTETRFRPSKLLQNHDVVSSMMVVIPGPESPYGVLGVDTSRKRMFTADDRNFLRAVAHVLAAAIERKQAEEKAEAFAVELQRSNGELEQFASIASHDLQEPLRKIQAFGDRLQIKCSEAVGEQGRQYIERMQSSAARMQTLINDLLSFSRVTTKAQPFIDVDLAAEARQVVSDLEGRIQQTGGRVELGDLPTVQADPTQMRQLFQNLIGNGLKFHKPGETPTVKVDGRMIASPHGGGDAASGGMLEITVRDDGIGFEEEYLDRIFQLFQRLHGRDEFEGTGIGLAICKKIVQRHGGAITAHSALDKGAAFIVTLPIKRSQAEEPT